MNRARMLVFNIIATVLLAISFVWSGTFAFCHYSPYASLCNRSYVYWIIGAIAAATVLMVFFWHQYDATRALMRPKRKPLPHVISRYNLLERTEKLIWNVWDNSNNVVKSTLLDDLTDYGWIVEFDEGYPVVVSQKEFYHWLLGVARNQHILEGAGKAMICSPLSQRQNEGLSRKTLDAYSSLLESVYAIDYVNANVKRLKPDYALDVWTKIVKPLERIKPLVRV